MNINDFLKEPQLYAVKKDGVLQQSSGLANEVFMAKAVWLVREHQIMGCGDPDCDCIDKAFAKFAPGCTVVAVKIVEVDE